MNNITKGVSPNDMTNDPDLGPWNSLQCRQNTILGLTIPESNANGIVVAADIFPFPTTTGPPQTIFSIRNRVNENMVFTVAIQPSGFIDVSKFTTTWQTLFSSTQALDTSILGSNLRKFLSFCQPFLRYLESNHN